MDKVQKKEFVSSLNQSFKESALVLVARQSGLTVGEVTELRQKMRQAGAHYKVSKNTLSRLSVKGTQYEGLSDSFTGATAIAFSKEPVGAAKAAVEFSKKNDKLKIIIAQMGKKVLHESEIKALASLPSLDVLRSTIVNILQTPATRLAGVTQAPAGQLARVMGAYAEKS